MSSSPESGRELPHSNTLPSACPLNARQQTWNLVRFAAHIGLLYLAAPVAYVGEVDAILLSKLGYSDKVANLPAAAFLWTTAPFLVLFTWYFCHVRLLKPILVASYAVIAASGLIVAVALLQPQSNWTVAALIVHAILMGWCCGIVALFEWEVLARGVAEQRRGFALALAYGVGPILAVFSSFGTQLLLDGNLGPISMGKLAFPWDFFTLFAISAVVMALPALSAARYVIPMPSVEVAREPLLSGVFGGFRGFLRNRLLMCTSIAFLLVVLGGTTILPSVVLYMKEAIGEDPQKYAGYQFALRFAFKAVAGLLLGWMLVRTHARAGLLATTSFCLVGLVWALLVSGKWYLVSFGILGAGELYYVYYQNYLISSSHASMVRRNLAYAQLLALPVSLAPIMFGVISDSFGLRYSIETAAVLLAATLCFVQLVLPRWPSKHSSEESCSAALGEAVALCSLENTEPTLPTGRAGP
jgi:hypothetical protein